jgi:hypothetical protein
VTWTREKSEKKRKKVKFCSRARRKVAAEAVEGRIARRRTSTHAVRCCVRPASATHGAARRQNEFAKTKKVELSLLSCIRSSSSLYLSLINVSPVHAAQSMTPTTPL